MTGSILILAAGAGSPWLAYLMIGIIVMMIVLLATSSRTDGPVCRQCKERNRIGARFCAQCGKGLQSGHGAHADHSQPTNDAHAGGNHPSP